MAFLKTYNRYLEYQLSKVLFKRAMEKKNDKAFKKRQKSWKRMELMEKAKKQIAEDDRLRIIAKEKGISLRKYKKLIKTEEVEKMLIESKTISSTVPNTEEFQQEIENRINSIKGEYLDISAKDIHLELGGYPNNGQHAMYTCCNVMLKLMKETDTILPGGPKSNHGASLVIRYYKR